MNMRRTGVVAGASLAAVAGLAAVLSSAGLLETDDAAKAGSSALSLYGVATVVHTGADGTVLDTQSVHNRLLDEGEDFILTQVFRNGTTAVADSQQIGAICLSAQDYPDLDTNHNWESDLSRDKFHNDHDGEYSDGDITKANTRPCLTDTSVMMVGQSATVGSLTFTANTSDGSSNWVPGQQVKTIGVCRADSGPTNSCTAPLFAVVDITDVRLNLDETLTVTYTFNMVSNED